MISWKLSVFFHLFQMKTSIALFCLALSIFFSCRSQSPAKDEQNTVAKLVDSSNYLWKKQLETASWDKSYNFQMVVIRDTLWVLHPDGNWFSHDGEQWTKSNLPNAINNLAFLDYIVFQDALYGLGFFEGNIERYVFKPQVYKSTNLLHWELLTEHSNLPHRFFYHPFVFGDKIWILGGEDASQPYDDLWSSRDGIHWTQESLHLPCGKRSSSQIVSAFGKLFLLNNDVWSSTNGLQWTLETAEILKGESLFGYSAVVFDEKIWLIGCNRNGNFTSKVLVSSDGKNWEAMDAPWSPRGGVASAVFKNKIYITGGKYGGLEENNQTTRFVYSNDVWVLEKKMDAGSK